MGDNVFWQLTQAMPEVTRSRGHTIGPEIPLTQEPNQWASTSTDRTPALLSDAAESNSKASRKKTFSRTSSRSSIPGQPQPPRRAQSFDAKEFGRLCSSVSEQVWGRGPGIIRSDESRSLPRTKSMPIQPAASHTLFQKKPPSAPVKTGKTILIRANTRPENNSRALDLNESSDDDNDEPSSSYRAMPPPALPPHISPVKRPPKRAIPSPQSSPSRAPPPSKKLSIQPHSITPQPKPSARDGVENKSEPPLQKPQVEPPIAPARAGPEPPAAVLLSQPKVKSRTLGMRPQASFYGAKGSRDITASQAPKPKFKSPLMPGSQAATSQSEFEEFDWGSLNSDDLETLKQYD
ncbi:hypothetical protein DL96DRAFT_1599843 [Flagelloscypha sp. PMI_526]|nr:hypothetical protein DL96DRAFT_1599843 [Flagelloscypha sp. PMI_526]